MTESESGASHIEQVSTGAPTLDAVLDGGLPAERTHLLTGTPGTGKSTLAMQFIQAGLDHDERCLFISTEQTPDELRDGFAPFAFDLDDPNLAITTLHAMPGTTEYGDDHLQLRTLHGEGRLDDAEVEFTPENIINYLRQGGGCDRVVVDSVSGLNVLTDDQALFRRTVLQLVRLFNDELGATALFTAEHYNVSDRSGVETIGSSDALQYSTHGVIRVWREALDGEYHRFIDVMKMRGIDHDTRQYEIEFDETGLHIVPRNRAHSERFIDHRHHSTGIAGLDALLDGGFLTGTGTLLEHDGKANYDALLGAMVAQALDTGKSVALVPTVDMNKRRLGTLTAGMDESLDDLLDDDRLFILDMVGGWEEGHRNVFDVQREDAGAKYLLREINDRSASEGMLSIINTEAKTHALGEDRARELRYWQEANFVGPEDVMLDIHNPDVMNDQLAAFHVDAAQQVLRTWLGESGLQYMTLKKSPTGHLGSSRVVEYLDEPPYVRVEPP